MSVTWILGLRAFLAQPAPRSISSSIPLSCHYNLPCSIPNNLLSSAMPTRARALAAAQAAKTALATDALQPEEASPAPAAPPIKRKRTANPKVLAKPKTKAGAKQLSASDEEAAQRAESAVNRRLAELEARHSCDANLPTPRPVSSTRTTSVLSLSTSRKDIVALVAEQRLSAAGGSAGNESSSANAANRSGTLSDHESDKYSDDHDDESPIKKARVVIVPNPATPIAPPARKLTAAQKRENEAARQAAKEAQIIAKEEAAAKKVADREAKAKAKEDEKLKKKEDARKKKEDEKEAKAQEKQRAKEAKEAEKAMKPKRGKKVVSDQPIDEPTTTPTATAVAEGTGTKANAVGEDDNTEQTEGSKEKGKSKAGQPGVAKKVRATKSKVS